MKTHTLIKTSLILGVSLVGLGGLAQSASAASLTSIDKTALGGKLFDAEGRAGVTGPGDYEWTVGPNGATYPNGGLINIIWQDDTTVRWTINWTAGTGNVNLALAGGTPGSINYGTGNALAFNQFGIVTRALTETNLVEAGTIPVLVVDTINESSITGGSVSISSLAPATSGVQDIDEAYYASDTAINSISGTAKIDWPNLNPQDARARSRIFFKIKGYNNSLGPASLSQIGSASSGPSIQATPEPSAILGLVAITGLGLSLKFKGKDS